MSADNVYDDAVRAEAYATLEFPGSYWLAFRDLPQIIAKHVTGTDALDFGCGAGRSTRFLKRLGFNATGIDVSSSMIERARAIDPHGSYLLMNDGDFSVVKQSRFDLVLIAFAFDNIFGADRRRELLCGMRRLLKDDGRIVLLGSSPEIYTHEWASFTTEDFPENRHAKSGDTVRIVMTDVDDRRPVVDQFWSREDQLELFRTSDLSLIAHHAPLGRAGEPFQWVSETTVSPWAIDVLGKEP